MMQSLLHVCFVVLLLVLGRGLFGKPCSAIINKIRENALLSHQRGESVWKQRSQDYDSRLVSSKKKASENSALAGERDNELNYNKTRKQIFNGWFIRTVGIKRKSLWNYFINRHDGVSSICIIICCWKNEQQCEYDKHYLFLGFTDSKNNTIYRHLFPDPKAVKVRLISSNFEKSCLPSGTKDLNFNSRCRDMSSLTEQVWESPEYGYVHIFSNGSAKFHVFDKNSGFTINGSCVDGCRWSDSSLLDDNKIMEDQTIAENAVHRYGILRSRSSNDWNRSTQNYTSYMAIRRRLFSLYRKVIGQRASSWVGRFRMLLPSQYQVAWMGGYTNYIVRFNESELTYRGINSSCKPAKNFRQYYGTGLTHVENNWGSSFPIGWMWAQGSCLEKSFSSPKWKFWRKNGLKANRIMFITTGGLFKVGYLNIKAWMLAYRSPKIMWDFQTVCFDEINSFSFWHNRSLTLRAVSRKRNILRRILDGGDWRRVLDMTISAPSCSFIDPPIYIPSIYGFMNYPDGCEESHFATATIEAYFLNPTTKRKIRIESRKIPSCALEFGGNYRYRSISSK